MLEKLRLGVAGYAIAVVLTILAVLLRWLLDPFLGSQLTLVTIFGVVAFAVWLSGIIPAVVVVLLGYVACDYLFIDPRGSFGFDVPANFIGFLAYSVTCSIIISLGEAMRRAQRRAKNSNDLLRVTFTSIGDAVITTDNRGIVTYMNGIAESLTGWRESEARGKTLDVVFHIINEQTRRVEPNPALRALKEGFIVGLANHTVLVSKDGKEYPIDDSAAPIKDAQGNVHGAVLIFRDVSERRQTEKALQRSEEELSDFFENASIAIHWVGPDGTIQRANRMELEMMGYSREEYIGRKISDFHVDQHEIEDILDCLHRGETMHNRPAQMRRKDGEIREVIITSNALFEDGKLAHSRCFTQDVTEFRLAQKAQVLLASIVASSDDAIVSKSLDGIIQSWNTAAERIFGYTAKQAIGQHIKLIIPPDRVKEEDEIISRLRAGERISHFETKRLRSDGRLIDVSLTISPIRDETGKIIGASKIARDITKNKQAEAELRAKDTELQLVTETTPLILTRCSRDLRYLFVNRAASDLFGLTPQQMIGKPIVEIMGEDAFEQIKPHIDRVLQGQVVEFEDRIQYSGTGPRWVRANYLPERDSQNNVVGWLASIADITERKRAEEALRKSEERFRDLANNIDQFAWTCDRLSEATWYNRRWYEYTGTTFEEMKGDGWKKVHHPDHIDRVVAGLNHSLETGKPWEDIFPLKGKDGNYRWFLSRSHPIRDANGMIVRWFGTNTDITQQRELEEALRETDQRKNEFLAMLAHELRNPLAPIRNAVEILKVQGPAKADLEWGREVIDRQVQHMARLLDDLLDVSRISHNKMELRKQRVELSSIIHTSVETNRPFLEAQNHKLTLSLQEKPVYLYADPVRLAQIFSNLLNNALKYTSPGGHIEITSAQSNDEVVVTVKDNGIGIEAEMLERIFDMFSQGKGILERSQDGLGIGLSLVRGLVELHNGTISVRSQGAGKGSEFIVRLPVDATPAAEGPQPPLEPQEPGAAKFRLLIVDDNHDSADSLAMLLKMMEHDVVTAYNGEEALVAADKVKPEVILLDIGMPKLNGYEVCRRLRKQPGGQDFLLIAVTGWGQDSDRHLIKEAGFDHHLVKPVDPNDLLQVLASHPSKNHD